MTESPNAHTPSAENAHVGDLCWCPSADGSGHYWHPRICPPEPVSDRRLLDAVIGLDESEYLFHDGQWYVRAIAVRRIVGNGVTQ